MRISLISMFILGMPLQAHADGELDLAVKVGPNAATLAHENRVSRYGFSGGLAGYFEWSLPERFSFGIQVESLYTPRGAEVVLEGQTQGTFRQHYLDLVAAARPGLRFGPASTYLLLGSSLNFLVSANRENVSGSREDVTDDLRRFDVALLGGAGVAVHLPPRALGPFGQPTVFVEVRYDVGLLDIDPANGGFENRTLSLMLGLSLVVSGGEPASTASSAE